MCGQYALLRHGHLSVSLWVGDDVWRVGSGGSWTSPLWHLGPSDGQDVLDEGGVVDAAVGVLLTLHQPVHLVLGHPLPEGGQHVPQLGAHHRAIALLVEDAQPLHEVLEAALVLGAGDVLEHGQKGLEVQQLHVHLLGLGLAQHGQHLGIGGVVSKRPHHVAALRVRDLHLARRRLVEQRERLAELLDLVRREVQWHALQVQLGLGRLWRGHWGGRRRLFLLGLRLLDLGLLGFHLLGRHGVENRYYAA
ncbi:hypothetical protein AALO_G00073910 [Alosa alosa]|uniref:Uncharacterized protein n=1 Tax=Alosa alosa TaxID=278164 RepID=A0AAV6H3G2_9TELE|nr:hypothetical protein AALO_G00073910 [Alosa alosa]